MALTAYGVAVAVKPKDEDTLRQGAGRVELRHSDLEAASRGAWRELVDWWRAGVSLARIRISTEILFRQPSEMRAQRRPCGLSADRG